MALRRSIKMAKLSPITESNRMDSRVLWVAALATMVGLSSACNGLKNGRAGLDGQQNLDPGATLDDDDGAASLTDQSSQATLITAPKPPAAPDCETPFRANDHVGTFHCADDYLTAMAAFPEETPDAKYFVYRGLSFLIAAPELSNGLNTFLGVFSVDGVLPWSRNIYGDGGAIDLVARGLRPESPIDLGVTLVPATGPSSTLTVTPRYSSYLTTETTNDGGAEPASPTRGSLTLIQPLDAALDSFRMKLVFRGLKSFNVTDGTPIDALQGCARPGAVMPCLEDDTARDLNKRTHIAWYDAQAQSTVYFALDNTAAGFVYLTELGIAPGEYVTLVPRQSPVGPVTELTLIEQTGCSTTTGAITGCTNQGTNPRRLKIALRQLVDKATPITIAAAQKAVAILAPLTGTSITADQLIDMNGSSGLAPGGFFFDLFASAVRSSKGGSNVNDVYFAFLNIAADLKRYVVDDLQRAYSQAPGMIFAFPHEIFRTPNDIQLTARELKLVRTLIGVLAAAGEVAANGLRIGGSVITKELVWDSQRDDIDYVSLTNALNTGFMLVLDENKNASFYRKTVSGQLAAFDDLVGDLSAVGCVSSALVACLPNGWGTHYRTLIGELKSAVDAAESASAPQTLGHWEISGYTCSDSWPNSSGNCAAIGANVAGSGGGFEFPNPQPAARPFTADFGALAFTHRLRSPLTTAGVPFYVRTLPNGAKRIAVCSDLGNTPERQACKNGATATEPLYFDALTQHAVTKVGMRVPSLANPDVFIDAMMMPKAPDPALGLNTNEQMDRLMDVVQPLLDRTVDSPLSRVMDLVEDL